MRIFTPNVKTVREITRYVSPKEIETARFKRYNQPIINDGNRACDEFFRIEELFDRKKDVALMTNYGVDDIPVIERSSRQARDIAKLSLINPSGIETNLPYYVDIIGRNDRIYLEQYGTKNPKHPHKIMGDGKYEKFILDDVVNIKYYAKEISSNDEKVFEKEALSLLKDGFPLTSVLKLMEKSALKSSDGKTRTSMGLMTFLAEFPKYRTYVITHDWKKNEVFDTCGAEMFSQVLEMCEGDHETAFRIIYDCRKRMSDERRLTDKKYLELGQKLYKIDNRWTKVKADIVQSVIGKIHNKKTLAQVDSMIHDKVPVEQILEAVM